MREHIYIFEDGAVKVGGPPSDDDLQNCDDGYLTIIEADSLLEYFEGDWVPLERLEQS